MAVHKDANTLVITPVNIGLDDGQDIHSVNIMEFLITFVGAILLLCYLTLFGYRFTVGKMDSSTKRDWDTILIILVVATFIMVFLVLKWKLTYT